MWVEKYRPKSISKLVNQKDIVNSLKSFLKKKSEIPHLLFTGSAGTGKTTTALCITKEILGEYWKDFTLELNASDERGINMVRERVKKFSRFAGLNTQIPFKIIILDEADEMTSDAQTALRRIIEDTAKYCRFILIANNISRIIDPLQSRCVIFKFIRISENEIIGYLKTITKNEKISFDDDGLKEICNHANGDLRHAINILQATASIGSITKTNVKSVTKINKTDNVGKILQLSLNQKITQARNEMIELIKVYGMSESDFLKFLNQIAFKIEDNKISNEVIKIIAKYDYRILVGANPEIQLSALLVELSNISAERGI